MSKVDTKEIKCFDRYITIMMFGQFDHPKILTSNLELLYEFIDKQVSGGVNSKGYGNGMRAILKEARKYARYNKRIISKRQVHELIKIHEKADEVWVKIPYASDYIFRAIFSLVNKYREQGEPPEVITTMYGKRRRDVFYKDQTYSFNKICSNNDPEIKKALNYDLNSDGCALGGKF